MTPEMPTQELPPAAESPAPAPSPTWSGEALGAGVARAEADEPESSDPTPVEMPAETPTGGAGRPPAVPAGPTLIGFLILGDRQVGFVDPVFLDGERRVIQACEDAGDEERISDFAEIALSFRTEPWDTGIVVERHVGAPRLHAFRFADGTILCGERGQVSAALAARFHEFFRAGGTASAPLLALDVLSFLGYEAALAHDLAVKQFTALAPPQAPLVSHADAAGTGTGGVAGEGNIAVSASGGSHGGSTVDARATLRLFRHHFRYLTIAGTVLMPEDAGIICLPREELRHLMVSTLTLARSGRLFTVACLFFGALAVWLEEPLRSFYDLTPQQLGLAVKGIALTALIWLIYELAAAFKGLSRRRLVDCMLERMTILMRRS